MPRSLNLCISLTSPTKTLYALSSAPYVPQSLLLIQDCFGMYWYQYFRLNCVLLCYQLYHSVHSLSRCKHWFIYRVSQEECEILRQSVPYVKLYRYNPKHLYPKLNGYGVNGHRKVWASVVPTYCTPSVTPYSSTAQARQGDIVIQWPWRKLYSTVALTSQDNDRSGGLRKVLRSLRRAKTWMREFL